MIGRDVLKKASLGVVRFVTSTVVRVLNSIDHDNLFPFELASNAELQNQRAMFCYAHARRVSSVQLVLSFYSNG